MVSWRLICAVALQLTPSPFIIPAAVLENGVGVPLVALQVGIGVFRLLREAEHLHQNGGQLAAGEGLAGLKFPSESPLHDAELRPAVDGAGGPAPGRVRHDRRGWAGRQASENAIAGSGTAQCPFSCSFHFIPSRF